ncbi:MAG: ATP-binding protein, partial [Stellaceae bacterium]
GIAHDFNNILAVVLGNLETLERRVTDKAVLRLAVQAKEGALRGARLVHTLLAFARKQPLKPEVASPNRLVQEFLPIFEGAAGDAIEIELRLSPTVHACRMDPAQFQSAVLNLVANSSAAMPNGGRITIETEDAEFAAGEQRSPASDGFVRISVSDTGEGMAPAMVAKAFEPFFTTKAEGKGSGLGLAQVYGFAKQSGGEVRLESAPGVGTKVHLYLPRSMATETLATELGGSAPEAPSGAPAATIMVVDDNPGVRAVLSEMVQSLAYEAVEAEDGRAALERIKSGKRIDLVITDYLMPHGMSGPDLAREIATLDRRIKVLLVSGILPADGDASGVPILQKPISLGLLGQAIRQQLARTDNAGSG